MKMPDPAQILKRAGNTMATCVWNLTQVRGVKLGEKSRLLYFLVSMCRLFMFPWQRRLNARCNVNSCVSAGSRLHSVLQSFTPDALQIYKTENVWEPWTRMIFETLLTAECERKKFVAAGYQRRIWAQECISLGHGQVQSWHHMQEYHSSVFQHKCVAERYVFENRGQHEYLEKVFQQCASGSCRCTYTFKANKTHLFTCKKLIVFICLYRRKVCRP